MDDEGFFNNYLFSSMDDEHSFLVLLSSAMDDEHFFLFPYLPSRRKVFFLGLISHSR